MQEDEDDVDDMTQAHAVPVGLQDLVHTFLTDFIVYSDGLVDSLHLPCDLAAVAASVPRNYTAYSHSCVLTK
eukprot:332897-Amphidinium_carterae.1